MVNLMISLPEEQATKLSAELNSLLVITKLFGGDNDKFAMTKQLIENLERAINNK